MSDAAFAQRADQMAFARRAKQIYDNLLFNTRPYVIGVERIRNRFIDEPNLPLAAVKTQDHLLDRYSTQFYRRVDVVEGQDALTPELASHMQSYALNFEVIFGEIKTLVYSRLGEYDEGGRRCRPSSVNKDYVNGVALERIHIERFKGDYNKWPNFKSKFEQFFHNNENMSDMHRFLRLDALIEVDSEPYQLILGIERVGENYAVAWERLCDMYDNKCKIIDDMVNAFIDMPKMRSSTRSELMNVVNAVHNMTKTLVRFPEAGVQHWDAIIVPVLLRKLDDKTVELWSQERPQREVSKLPPIMKFLENRAESLNNNAAAAQAQPAAYNPFRSKQKEHGSTEC